MTVTLIRVFIAGRAGMTMLAEVRAVGSPAARRRNTPTLQRGGHRVRGKGKPQRYDDGVCRSKEVMETGIPDRGCGRQAVRRLTATAPSTPVAVQAAMW